MGGNGWMKYQQWRSSLMKNLSRRKKGGYQQDWRIKKWKKSMRVSSQERVRGRKIKRENNQYYNNNNNGNNLDERAYVWQAYPLNHSKPQGVIVLIWNIGSCVWTLSLQLVSLIWKSRWTFKSWKLIGKDPHWGSALRSYNILSLPVHTLLALVQCDNQAQLTPTAMSSWSRQTVYLLKLQAQIYFSFLRLPLSGIFNSDERSNQWKG